MQYTRGQGNAGNIQINASDIIIFDGVGHNFPSVAASTVEQGAVGNGGTIVINTNDLYLTNRARFTTSTYGQGNAGNITITANNFTANQGVIESKTDRTGKAGNINFYIKNNLNLTDSEIAANTTEVSTGNGGNIFIDPDVVNLNNSAIAVNSQGTGIGGSITLIGNQVILTNSSITAETASNQGGDITLQIPQYLMFLDRSKITSTAGTTQSGGDGGNIKINAPLIVGLPTNLHHKIIANAYTGKGGNIDITTNGIFGNQYIDIQASSQFGINGSVNINTPGIDPANGLVQLPSAPVDPSQLVNRDFCKKISQDSSFVVKGKGGLPVSANDLLTADMTWEDWRSLSENIGKVSNSNSKTSLLIENPREQNKIITGQDWFKNNKGSIIITSEPRKLLADAGNFSPLDCEQFRRLNVK